MRPKGSQEPSFNCLVHSSQTLNATRAQNKRRKKQERKGSKLWGPPAVMFLSAFTYPPLPTPSNCCQQRNLPVMFSHYLSWPVLSCSTPLPMGSPQWALTLVFLLIPILSLSSNSSIPASSGPAAAAAKPAMSAWRPVQLRPYRSTALFDFAVNPRNGAPPIPSLLHTPFSHCLLRHHRTWPAWPIKHFRDTTLVPVFQAAGHYQWAVAAITIAS